VASNAPATDYSRDDRAGLGVRVLAYLLDSLVLFVFSMVFVIIAGLNIFIRSDYGDAQPSDEAFMTFALILVATIPAWFIVSLLIWRRRGQSVGQYVLGLQTAREDGGRAGTLRLLMHLLALHPLIFHPVFGAFWTFFAYYSWAATESKSLVVGAVALTLLCGIAPVVAFVSAAADPGRRALHDRIAGTRVLRLRA
jgi:uncharacterized RDD family membrane protein YckC